MTRLEDLQAEPWRFNFYSLLREMERETPDKPRIGDSSTLSEEVVALSQDPYLAFPAANIAAVSRAAHGVPRLHTRFLGMFGPQGALPLHMTEEAHRWLFRDPSFSRFVDIVSTRFLQLFYRAWADARPIGQMERPESDRFFAYLGSFEGIATPAMRQADSVDDFAKVPFAGLANIHVKSAATLEQFLHGVFGLDVEVRQWIGSWMTFEENDRMRLGGAQAAMGVNAFLGSRVHSICERIRVRIRCKDRAEYESLLPGGRQFRRLADALFFFLGYRHEIEVELGIPARQAMGVRLGGEGRLGWTSWLAPDKAPPEGAFYFECRFDPMNRRESGKTTM